MPRDVYSGLCGNCRNLARLNRSPSFKGDRILVMMFPYDLPFLPGSGPPERWDVVVFRYPEEPEVSYIKRLVGLPEETIRISHGDVYVKKNGSPSFVMRASLCGIRPRCRSTSTTTAINQGLSPIFPSGAAGTATAPGGRSLILAKAGTRRTSADLCLVLDSRWHSAIARTDRRSILRSQRRNGPSYDIETWFPSRSNGRPCWRTSRYRAAAGDADHRLLRLQYQHVGRSNQLHG